MANRRSLSPSGKLKLVDKKFKFEPVAIYLCNYEIELIFVNNDVADEFLIDFEFFENDGKPPEDQNCLVDGHDYKVMPVEININAKDALNELIARKAFNKDHDEPGLFDWV